MLGRSNPRVKRLRRLARSKSQRALGRSFVVDGPLAVAAALEVGRGYLQDVYVSADFGDGAASQVSRVLEMAEAAGCNVVRVSPGALEHVGASSSSQGIVATARFVDVPLASLRAASRLLVCAGVQDPGNLGAVLRSAVAAGWDGVICAGACVDVYNPKSVRASAGAIFRTDLVVAGATASVLKQCRSWGMRIIGAAPKGGADHTTIDWAAPFAVVLGNESAGLPPESRELLELMVTVPMASGTESLNVAMTAAVLCFEATRGIRGEPIVACHGPSEDSENRV